MITVEIDGIPTTEQAEVLFVFASLLKATSKDGGKKRAAGLKPSWKIDKSHEAAIFSHITKWKRGEKIDPESGVHALVHSAWRCLAIAAQETYGYTSGEVDMGSLPKQQVPAPDVLRDTDPVDGSGSLENEPFWSSGVEATAARAAELAVRHAASRRCCRDMEGHE